MIFSQSHFGYCLEDVLWDMKDECRETSKEATAIIQEKDSNGLN